VGSALVSLNLPGVDLGNEAVVVFDAAIETLAFEHADLDSTMFSQLACLGGEVELNPPEHAARLGRWEGGVESGGSVGREVVVLSRDASGVGAEFAQRCVEPFGENTLPASFTTLVFDQNRIHAVIAACQSCGRPTQM
jgi:hypothetical protein